MSMTDKDWARQCATYGWKVLAAFVGFFAGWAFLRWLGWW